MIKSSTEIKRDTEVGNSSKSRGKGLQRKQTRIMPQAEPLYLDRVAALLQFSYYGQGKV